MVCIASAVNAVRSTNTLLHFEYEAERSISQAAQPIEAPKSEVNVACNVRDASKNVDGRKLHKVVPVKVWLNDPSKSLITWAYLDEGSEVSVCTTAFAKQLGAKLTSATVKLCTSNAVTRVNWKIDCMHVPGVDEPEISAKNFSPRCHC